MNSQFYILAQLVLSLLGKVLAESNGGFETRVWEPFPTDVALLPQSSVRQVAAASEILCWILGSVEKDLVNLACYRDQECLLVSTSLTLNRTTETQGWSCHESQICLSSSGVPVTKGYEEKDAVCPADFRRVCTSEGKRSLPQARIRYQKRASCTAPFEETEYGCVYRNSSGMEACEARRRCLSLGGDLASPTSRDHFLKLVNYAEQVYGSKSFNLWLGVFRWDGSWEYIRDGRNPGPYGQGDWGSNDPDEGPGEACARLTLFEGKIILGDMKCTSTYQSLCEVFF